MTIQRSAADETTIANLRDAEFALGLEDFHDEYVEAAFELLELALVRAADQPRVAERAASYLFQLSLVKSDIDAAKALVQRYPILLESAPRTVQKLNHDLSEGITIGLRVLLRLGELAEVQRLIGNNPAAWSMGRILMGELAWQRGEADDARRWWRDASMAVDQNGLPLQDMFDAIEAMAQIDIECRLCGNGNGLEDEECAYCGDSLYQRTLLLESHLIDDLAPALIARVMLAELDARDGHLAEAQGHTQIVLDALALDHPARASLEALEQHCRPVPTPAEMARDLAEAHPEGCWALEAPEVLVGRIEALHDGWSGVPLRLRETLVRRLIATSEDAVAEALLEHAFDASKQPATVHKLRGLLQTRREQRAAAILGEAEAAFEQGQWEPALKLATRVDAETPSSDTARMLRAHALIALGNDLAALDELRSLSNAADETQQTASRLLMARILEAQHDEAGALEVLAGATHADAEEIRARIGRHQRHEPFVRLERAQSGVMYDTLTRENDFPQIHGTFAIALRAISRPAGVSSEEWAQTLFIASRSFLQSLAGLREMDGDAVFALRYISQPDPSVVERGQISIALLIHVSAPDEQSCLNTAHRVHSCLWSALPGQESQAYQFETVVDGAELLTLLQPFEPVSFAEIVRREDTSRAEKTQYAAYPFMPGGLSLHNLCWALLRQPGPAMLSLHLQPTVLMPWEQAGMARAAQPAEPTPWSSFKLNDAADSLGRITDSWQEQANRDQLSYLSAQAYLMAVNVVGGAGSLEVLPESCAAALFGSAQPVGSTMYGGYQIVRAATPDEEQAAQRNCEQIDLERWAFTTAPDGLGRLRTLVSEFEAAAAFRLPISSLTGVPGLTLIATRPIVPPANMPTHGLLLGESVARVRGERMRVIQATADRRRHTFMLGMTGAGKSTLLQSMALQDINEGRGVCVIDPHGDLIDDLLLRIPPHRAADVILFDPSDTERPLGLNLLEWSTEEEKNLIVTEFIGMLTRMYDPNQIGIVGPRFQHNVRNAMLTAMTEPHNTLIEALRVLSDTNYARSLLPKVTDPLVLMYWKQQIANTSDFHKSEILDYLVSKFTRFLGDEVVRNIVGQRRTTLNFRQIMDEGRILLVSLSKGKIFPENSQFLGLLLVQRLLVTALGRANVPISQRPDFYLYVDEFQNFATNLFNSIFSEGRKYGLVTITANQYLAQLDAGTRQAIFGNVGTLISFRIGVEDANVLAPEMYPTLTRDDLINLPRYTCAARLLMNGMAEHPFTMQTFPVLQTPNAQHADQIRAASRARYGAAVEDVRGEIRGRFVTGD